MFPPVTIVWPCPLSVDEYAAAGRGVVVPRPACPDCGGVVAWWSGYHRFVRADGVARAIFVPRVRCGACRSTTVVLPSFVAVGRLDVVESIGTVIDLVVDGGSGVRPAASAVDVPHTTARGWVRRFGSRARVLAVAFAALVVELGSDPIRVVVDAAVYAVAAITAAFEAAGGLAGWAVLGRWRFASTVCGGSLLAANTNTPSIVVGSRRFMPPTPST